MASRHPGAAVLGADTVVSLDGRSLGSPSDAREAGEMLDALSGRAHEVLTAVHLIANGVETAAIDRAVVRFRDIDARTRDWYLRSGEWAGRAGGYAIQGAGWAFVTRLVGDRTTVVGLPMAVVLRLLRAGTPAAR